MREEEKVKRRRVAEAEPEQGLEMERRKLKRTARFEGEPSSIHKPALVIGPSLLSLPFPCWWLYKCTLIPSPCFSFL